MPKLSRLIDKWGTPTVLLFIFLQLFKLMKKLGLPVKEDGWRKITSVYLRKEESKFILACFGLDLARVQKEKINEILSGFFKEYPQSLFRPEYSRFTTQAVPHPDFEFIEASFNSEGALTGIVVPRPSSLDQSREKLATAFFIEIYNYTRHLPDIKRQLTLQKLLFRKASRERPHARAFRTFFTRLLTASYISFETLPADAGNHKRFLPPPFLKRIHPGMGIFNAVCRLFETSGEADIWIQCHHACIDGLPMQEMLDTLKMRFRKAVTFTFSVPPAVTDVCSHDKKKPVHFLTQHINFGRLVSMVETNNRTGDKTTQNLTVFRLFLWKLGNHPTFRGKKLLIPVNLPQKKGLQRSLGFVVLRPGKFFDSTLPDHGLENFEKEFNRQVKASIVRKSESYELLELYSLLPPALFQLITKTALLEGAQELAGSIGVSFIHTAEYFIAPYSDIHTDGFIALSNLNLPTEDGKKLGCISIKGPERKINAYMAAIKEIAEGTND